ncbi:MAG: SRPBCC family protein [Flavobacteriales bacterium]|nr:SRPBCC family protein [Flavobacteriales bacterium]
MRALKILLVLLLVIAALLVILGMTGQDRYRIERSVSIAAPVEAVWGHVSSLGAMDKWSPWNELDPSMKKTMEGTDGTVGAISKWEGNKDVGKGEQRIDSIVPNSLLRTHLTFQEPWTSETDALIELAPDAEGTKVTWAMVGENDFMGKLMSKFMDMDAMLGKDFEKGLALLKSQAESAHAARPTFEIKTIERSASLFVGKRDVVKWADMKTFFGENFTSGMGAIGKAGVAPAGAPSGVYFEWNVEEQTADMIAGIPVPLTARAKLKGLDLYEAPASKALLIEYRGGYEGMGPAHEAMDAYINANGLTHHTNVIEEYITDPGSEPDSTKWLTNIIYLIK